MHPVVLIALKDLKQLLRDRVGLFFLVGFPVMIGVFFGFVFGGGNQSGSIHLTVALVNEDPSEYSAKFVEALESGGSVGLVRTNREPALEMVRKGKLAGVIVVPEGFGETAGMMWGGKPATVRVGVDPARKAEAGMLKGLVLEAAGQLVPHRMNRFLSSTNGMAELFDEETLAGGQVGTVLPVEVEGALTNLFESLKQLRKANLVATSRSESSGAMPDMSVVKVEQIDVVRERRNGELAKVRSSWDITFPQAIMWGVLACAAGFAVTIVREQVRGTLLRLQVSSIPRWQVLAGKSLACFISVIFVVLFLIGVGMAFGMRPKEPLLLSLAVVCVASCFVGITMLMAVWGKTEEAVGGAAWAVGMVMSMFGGGMIPLTFMPAFMKSISHISPFKWAILSLEGAIWREFTFAEMLFPCGMLLAIGAGTFAIGHAILKRRLA
ncbi:MAG: ABC transporter permease [Verrucomicrobia bacterium]|nr:ABC transporter permease [Verrucomicrobiota bacterium]